MDNPLAPLVETLSALADGGLGWLWQWPTWAWWQAGGSLAMSLLVGRRLSRIGYRERSVWVSPLRGIGRVGFLAGLAAILIVTLWLAYVVFVTFLARPAAEAAIYLRELAHAFWPDRLAGLTAGLLVGGVVGAVAWWWLARVVEPWLNRISHQGTRLSGRLDGLTDIRTVAESLPKAKAFDPKKYFADGEMFLGM